MSIHKVSSKSQPRAQRIATSPGSPSIRPAPSRVQSTLASTLHRDKLDTRPAPGHSAQIVRSFAQDQASEPPPPTRLRRNSLRRGLSNTSASPTTSTPPGYDGTPTMDLGRAAKILRDNLDRLDTAAGGSRDGTFGLADLQAVAADPSASWSLRAAAQQFLADPNALNALDVAGGPRVDRVFSKKDLDRVISEQAASPGGPTLDEVADVLGRQANFDLVDAAKDGKTDGIISRRDLEIVAADDSAPQELRDTAQAILDNDNLFNALDVGRGDRRDGHIAMQDIRNIQYSPTPETGRQWTQSDDQALQRVLESGQGFDDADLFEGVRQTDRGNCASTAVIKAAMDRYGSDVFKDAERTDDGGYRVTLQDGSEVAVSREELEAAATGAHYQGDSPEARSYATLCYAVMAKRAQELGHEGSQTYAEALRSLANGENTAEVPHYLGLRDQVKRIDVDDIEGQSGVVAFGNGHAVYVDTVDGETFTDAWGSRHEFDGTNEVNKPDNALEGAYIFV